MVYALLHGGGILPALRSCTPPVKLVRFDRMRVCLDVQSAVSQRAGVGRYTRQLAEHLGATAGSHELELFYFDFKRQGRPFSVPNAIFHANHWIPGRLAQAAWKRFDMPAFDRLAGPSDLYHFPNFILPPLRRGRTVVTIHDVSFMRYPQFAEEANLRYLTAKIRDTVARADAVITDSQFSADEIVALLHAPPEKVFPIHLGIDPSFTPQSVDRVAAMRQTFDLQRPYLLAVGTLEPRKNIPFLIGVFEQMNDFDGDLVLAGRLGWKHDSLVERIAASPQASRIHHLDNITDDLLPPLYGGAACLLQASFYEGFGFPPLEAMACGTPVLSSRGGSLPEVIGTAAPLLDTDAPAVWCEAIGALLREDDDAHRVARQQHAAQYRWDVTAARTWKVYDEVMA